VIFDHDAACRDPSYLSEQRLLIVGMMEHIDHHDSVEGAVRKGKQHSIELANGNVRLGTHHDVDAVHPKIATLSFDSLGQ
jgi:hypothetical protein